MDPFDAGPSFLEAFRRGEPSAVTQVYLHYERLVLRFLVSSGVFPGGGRARRATAGSELEDLIQETFRRALSPRARASFDGQRPFKNYLFTIARNLAWTEHRRRRRLVLAGDPFVFSTGSGVADPALGVCGPASDDARVVLENREFVGLIDRFLTRLSPEAREVFESRYFLGLSQEETASRMGCHRARIRGVEGRVRRSLSAHMAGTGYLQRFTSKKTASHNADNIHYVN